MLHSSSSVQDHDQIEEDRIRRERLRGSDRGTLVGVCIPAALPPGLPSLVCALWSIDTASEGVDNTQR